MRCDALFRLTLPALLLAACATTPELSGPPDYTRIASQQLTPNGRLIVDCVQEAIRTGHFHRVSDPDTELVRFVCEGAPARAMFDGLADRSREIGSEFVFEGAVYRSTTLVRRNLFGADFCRRDGEAYSCEINLNVGAFARP